MLGTGWTGFTPLGVADYNGDGHPDVIARQDFTDASATAGTLVVFTGAGNRLFISTGWPKEFNIGFNNQQAQFVNAVGTPNAIVHISGNVELDLSGYDDIQIAPGVQIFGDRTTNPKDPGSTRPPSREGC